MKWKKVFFSPALSKQPSHLWEPSNVLFLGRKQQQQQKKHHSSSTI
jgi:hypothetical protein